MTKYRLLLETDEGLEIVEGGDVEAHGPQQAMRQVAERLGAAALEKGVTLIAVPVSNWTEEVVRLEAAKPRLVVGGGEQMTVEEVVAEVEAEETEPEPEVSS